MIELDAIDTKIITILQEDARISMVNLADRVGLSETPCARRVKKLEEEGVIKQYVTLLNPELLGMSLHVFVNVRLARPNQESVEKFERAVRNLPQVTECYLVTGSYDYVLHICVADVAAVKDFIRNCLISICNLSETNSLVALEQVKSTTAVSLKSTGMRKGRSSR